MNITPTCVSIIFDNFTKEKRKEDSLGMEDINHNNHNTKTGIFKKNLGALYVVIVGIIFFFLIYRNQAVKGVLTALYSALKPVLTGLIIAFLINPLVMLLERTLLRGRFLVKKETASPKAKKAARGISIFLALFLMISTIILLFNLVIPQVIASIQGVISEFPGYVDTAIENAQTFADKNPIVSEGFLTLAQEFTEKLSHWLTTDFAERISSMAGILASGLMGVLGILYNLIVGIILSIYLLSGKERFLGSFKKATYALLDHRRADFFVKTMRRVNYIFSAAIIGKILDSIIIGLLCFIASGILGIFFSAIAKYSLLVSVIVGVTNVIPFFGPYIGGIPSTLLIMFVNPVHGLIFGAFLILLQQFDCNFLDPRMVGGRVGLPAFWSIFACLVGGSLFGFYGFILSVPSFAVFYYLLKTFVEERLKSKKLPVNTIDYMEQN
ncbi:AI-2E family transporter [Alloiococcus sp. CFN-8]|uniref:AI-2E family transporter n=1 Tax=Alloiococcus sp. CFN-8 TaxID=3416081 RepID=UPI003CE8FBAB